MTEKGSLTVFPSGKRAAPAVKPVFGEVVPLKAAGSSDRNFCISTASVVGRQDPRRQAAARGGSAVRNTLAEAEAKVNAG